VRDVRQDWKKVLAFMVGFWLFFLAAFAARKNESQMAFIFS
jgi:hypothetical protein